MNIDKYLENNLSIRACHHVHELCKPLYKLGITYFSFVRIYNDHSRISVCNHLDWQYYFYNRFLNEEYAKHHVVFEKMAKDNSITVWNTYPENEAYIDASSVFGLHDGVVLTEKKENYHELTHFAAEGNNTSIIHFCLSHIDVLKQFIAYVKENSLELIPDMEKEKIIAPELYVAKEERLIKNIDTITEASVKSFLDEIKLKRYYIPSASQNTDESYLTPREHECLNWMARGKSAWEIGQILNISKRTVEAHLNKVKMKMNSFKTGKMVFDAIGQGLIIMEEKIGGLRNA